MRWRRARAVRPGAWLPPARTRQRQLFARLVLREGGRHGWLLLDSAGLLEDRSPLGAGPEKEHNDPGEDGGGDDHDAPQPELVAELALDDCTDRVHDPERHHVQAQDAGPKVVG